MRYLMKLCFVLMPAMVTAQVRMPALHYGKLNIRFGNTHTRYAQNNELTDAGFAEQLPLTGWKGEKLNMQVLVRSSETIKDLQVKAGQLKTSQGSSIPSSQISIGFVGYVLSDGLNAEGHGCGIQPGGDSSLQADPILFVPSRSVAANTTQPVWISIRIPQNAKAGKYKGELQVFNGNKILRAVTYNIMVVDHILPPPSRFKFHLDLWQNPFSISRIEKLQPWSAAHFKAMEPYMKMLADAGQKTITVSMIHDPWRGQTYDIYQSMIRWIRKKDGSWIYDYSIFDAWVSFMMKQGIDQLINCYTMVPWNNRFYYFDEALGRDTVLIAQTGTPAFNAHWKPMLRNFVQHLKQKNWFHKTSIAMDERPLADMLKVIELVRSVDKDLKISLAGSYHKELTGTVFDYCIASAETFDTAALQHRIRAGSTTTFYTYCFEGYPNTFTFSPPAESAFMGWYAANKGFNGYLRWAYNCWPSNPLQDARFSTWSSGDTYFVYPGAGSSIRFEKLSEGIQDYEKIRILREALSRTKQIQKLQRLEAAIRTCEIKNIPASSAAAILQQARAVLNDL